MTGTRRAVAGVVYAATCVGGFLVLIVVFGALFGILHEVFRGTHPILQYWIPTIASFWLTERLVLRRLMRFFDRLDRWKAQEQ